MITAFAGTTISLASTMGPVKPAAKVIVVSGTVSAAAMACRSEPVPLSAVVVTASETGGTNVPRSAAPRSATTLPLPSPSVGRGWPRWSVVGVGVGGVVGVAASIAMLPGCGSIVCVGPPLLASGPRFATTGLASMPTSGPC